MTKYLNLQLFAELNTNTTGTDTLSAENKEFYDKQLIRLAKPNLIHDQFGQKRPIPKRGGKTIEFREFASLPKATTPITEGVTPNGNKLEVKSKTATVSQYGDYVTMSDVLDLTAIDPVVVEATEVIANQAGLTLDTITRDIIAAGSNVYYCPKKDGTEVLDRTNLDDTCTLTVDVIKRVAALLKGVNAPKIDGSYVGIIHPYVAYDLMADPAWIDVHKYSDATKIFEGEIGKIGGVRFVETSEAKVFDGGIYATLIFGSNAYGVTEIEGGGLQTIVKQLGSAGTGDPLNQRSSVGWKAIKTAERLVEAYLVRVESKSALGTDTLKNDGWKED